MHAQLSRAALGLGLVTACSSSPSATTPPDDDVAPAPRAASVALHSEATALETCARHRGGSESIAAFVTQANALPSPVDVPCVVASLPRPLAIVATSNKASAQPAANEKSPRIFLVFEKLVVSVVPEGKGAPFAELGEWVAPGRTLKGELEFPLSAPAAADAPFLALEQSNQSSACGACHRGESAHPTVPHGYVSAAFKPNTGLVAFAALEAEHEACARAHDSSSRCLLFHALFDFGPAGPGRFPADAETFP